MLFKFYNMWALHKDFQDAVAKSWEEPFSRAAQFVLKQKMVQLKPKLRLQNEQHFQHIM